MNDDKLYLLHISECLHLVADYVSGGRDVFLSSRLIQDAVVRRLQTMAESSQRLSDDLKRRYPEVDWRGLSGFRNVLVHNYLGVDIENVWQLVESKAPELRASIDRILEAQGTMRDEQA